MESLVSVVEEPGDSIELKPNIVDSENTVGGGVGDKKIKGMVVSGIVEEVKEGGNIGIGGDDQKEQHRMNYSPWKKPVDGKGAETPVMGAESWPALAGVCPKNSDAAIIKLPSVVPAQSADVNPASHPPSVQGPIRQPKGNGFGSTNPSHKHPSFHNQRTGSKCNHPPNGVPLFPVPIRVPHQQPPMPPFIHTVVPAPHIPVHEYPYQPYPGPFSNVDPKMVKAVRETTMQAFVPPSGYCGGVDASRSFQPPIRGDPNMYSCNISNRQPSVWFNNAWHHQHTFTPRDGTNIQQNIGLRAFVRPPFRGPASGFITGPSFPGHAPVFCVPPAAPPNSTRGLACFISHPSHPGFPVPISEEQLLRDQVVKQIEYYFSDENLQIDTDLLSIMDAEGWVPASKFANFIRVKRMSTDINFILDALRSSSTIEELDGKIRRRHEWSKWAPGCGQQTILSKPHTPEEQINEKATLAMEKADLIEGNTSGVLEGFMSLASNTESLENRLTSNNDTSKLECRNNSECNTNNNLLHGDAKSCLETGDSFETFDSEESEQSAAIKISQSVTSYMCISNKDSTDGNGNKNTGTNRYVCPGCVQRVSQSKCSAKNMGMLSDFTVQNLKHVSNDFVSEPSGYIEENNTFMLDKELELEQSTTTTHHLFSTRRIDDEDDEIDNKDVQRLIIVTQPLGVAMNLDVDGASRPFGHCSSSLRAKRLSPLALAEEAHSKRSRLSNPSELTGSPSFVGESDHDAGSPVVEVALLPPPMFQPDGDVVPMAPLSDVAEIRDTIPLSAPVVIIDGITVSSRFASLYRQLYDHHGHFSFAEPLLGLPCVKLAALDDALSIISEIAIYAEKDVSLEQVSSWEQRLRHLLLVGLGVGWVLDRLVSLHDRLLRRVDGSTRLNDVKSLLDQSDVDLKGLMSQQRDAEAEFSKVTSKLDGVLQSVAKVKFEKSSYEAEYAELNCSLSGDLILKDLM